VLHSIQKECRMRRFFVAPEFLNQESGVISGELFRHISTVLRLKSGDRFCLADGAGHEAEAKIASVGKDGIQVEIGPSRHSSSIGDSPRITVCQGLPKGEKTDLILQKCTELGVARIELFQGVRSVARLEDDRLAKRLSRWERIVQEAARQSGREDIPAVGFSGSLGEALRGNYSALKLLLWEGEEDLSLREVLEGRGKPETISVVIGPEGGLASEEAALAVDLGFIPVSLGKRILRTETAGLAVVSILQYVWGDVG
jgi:16S rRNA (uracil1498-N3)-methyltransferase